MSETTTGRGGIGIRINGAEREVPAGATIADLVAGLGREPRTVAVERNGEIARRDAWPSIRLEPGDRLEIVQFVQGG